ncbi:MAG: hypothetical protein KAY79_14735, partial [Nitrospira sp.]|nr:hypothetical protein [Nitrospira sp.]
PATAPMSRPQALLLARSIELGNGFLPAPTRAPPNLFHNSPLRRAKQGLDTTWPLGARSAVTLDDELLGGH